MPKLKTLLCCALAAGLILAGSGLVLTLFALAPQPVTPIAYFAAFGLVGSGLAWLCKQLPGTHAVTPSAIARMLAGSGQANPAPEALVAMDRG